MKRNEIYSNARRLMDENGLQAWSIAFDRSKRRGGLCIHARRTLQFGEAVLAVMSDEQCINTITHEIAHAMVGPGHQHDGTWQRQHRALGGNGERCHDTVVPGRWQGVCPNGHTMNRHAKSDKMFRGSCGQCSRRFDERYRYTWTDTSTGQVYTPDGVRVSRPTVSAVPSGRDVIAALQRIETTRTRVLAQGAKKTAETWETGFTDLSKLDW